MAVCEVRGLHARDSEDFCLLEYEILQCDRNSPTFRRSLLLPSSGSRCPRSVVSYKFTNISEECITVVFRVPALYLRGCDVLNPEVVLPTFGGTFCLLFQDTGLLISAKSRRIV